MTKYLLPAAIETDRQFSGRNPEVTYFGSFMLFSKADIRHPIGSRRQAVISGKYGGGVFCTLPDDTVCLCLYSAGHADADFRNGDSVIIVIRQYDYARQLIYGRILSKWQISADVKPPPRVSIHAAAFVPFRQMIKTKKLECKHMFR
jgi:hypothetical protein